MKIRIGFVSNSSSTSYVIAITRDFELSDEQRQKMIDNYEYFYDEGEEEEICLEAFEKLFQETLEKLCSSSQAWEEDTPLLYSMIVALKNEIVLTAIDGAPDAGCCVNVLSDKNKDDFLAKIQKLLPQDPH